MVLKIIWKKILAKTPYTEIQLTADLQQRLLQIKWLKFDKVIRNWDIFLKWEW